MRCRNAEIRQLTAAYTTLEHYFAAIQVYCTSNMTAVTIIVTLTRYIRS